MVVSGVRRRLREVSKTVSGVLGVRLGEGTGAAEPAADPAAGAEQGAVNAPADPSPADAAALRPEDGSLPPQAGAPGDPAPAGEPLAEVAAGALAVGPAPAVQPVAGGVHPASEPVAPESALPGEVADTDDAPDALPDLDPVLAAAVDAARAAAVEVAGAAVGEHLAVQPEPVPAGTGGAVATHAFASTERAYVGWRWSVTLARAEGSDDVTVDEVVLLPGEGALLAPEWVPWSERVQPGDLAAGDVLPAQGDDERLVPAYADPEAELAAEVTWELGLGRPRVLSREGRAEAAQRWYEGEAGPGAAVARQAPGRCADCGFLVLLTGGLRQAFGVCANAYAPDDGRVVALTHGCGAHSETVVDAAHAATSGMAVEDDEFELLPGGDPVPAS